MADSKEIALRTLMSKLADLLDEDQFAACEEIVRRAGVAPNDLDDTTIIKIAREHFNEKDYDRLTYETSPPMFPQATYDVPTYALSQFVKAVRAAPVTTTQEPK